MSGATAGTYRLLDAVPDGGPGAVHYALDDRTGRPALVRLLPEISGDPAARRRFAIELPAVAALYHPGIAPIEAWGEWEGVPYVASPLVGGHRLSDLLAAGRRPDRPSALRLLRGLASALDYAHRAGVVHGAVRSEAVLVDGDGSARLTDIGLAVVAGAPAAAAGPAGDARGLAAIAVQLLGTGWPLPMAADAVLRQGGTCTELVDALESPPVVIRPPGAAVQTPRQPARRRRRWAWVLPVVAVLLIAGAALGLLARGLAPGPTLALSAATARPGDSVTVTGSHLPPGQPGNVVIAGRPAPAAAFNADAGGRFSVSVVVPTGATGDQMIEACWGGSCPLQQVLHLPGAPASPPTAALPTAPTAIPVTPTPVQRRGLNPAITIGQQVARQGQTITVAGTGFDPQQQYQIFLEQGGKQVALQAPATPDGRGAFSEDVVISADAARGLATVAACVSPTVNPPVCARQRLLILR